MELFPGLVGKILAYLIAGHHAGLPDWYPDETGGAALSVRLEEGKRNLERIRDSLREFLPGPIPAPPAYVRQHPAGCHLWIRLLFSCLKDADCLDTESFLDGEQTGYRSGFPSLGDLQKRFDRYMADKTQSAQDTPVNAIRREILAACRAAAVEGPGLFSLTVPTGGGKTLSGLAFALDHAVKHAKSRIVYVIPYTSIIEQTANILADIFGRENVVEHHGNADPDKETPRTHLAAENWDAPIIVTTNVQFFESLYAARTSRCRKLHNLVNSVVILDEAQLLPPKLLLPCTDAIRYLANGYGVTFVFSTATQPTLPGLEPLPIVRDTAKLYERLQRTAIRFPASLQKSTSWDLLAAELQGHRQVLGIVNTRRDCHELFRRMPAGSIHLSALMCAAHRLKIIEQIKQRLEGEQVVRVISTQLVEAGVDFDFPVVYRALAGLDSIAQAAGRCNREGRNPALGQVTVFVPPTGRLPGLISKGVSTTVEWQACPGSLRTGRKRSPGTSSLFYAKVNDMGTQFHDLLVKDVHPDMYIQFRTAAEMFQVVDDREQRAVFVRYGEGQDLIAELRRTGPRRELMRRLQRYTVNLHERMAGEFLACGMLEEPWPGFLAQADWTLYDDTVGLDVYREGIKAEDLCV